MQDPTPEQLDLARAAMIVAACVVAAIDLALAIAWLATRRKVAAGLRAPIFAEKWSVVHVWIAGHGILAILVPVAFAAMAVSWAVEWLVNPKAGLSDIMRQPAWLIFGVTWVQNALFVAIPAAVIFKLYRASAAEVGLWPRPRLRWYVTPAWTAGILGLGRVTDRLSGYGLHALLPAATYRSLEDLSRFVSVDSLFPRKDLHASPLLFVNLILVVAVAAPIGEEFLFRAFLHRCTTRRFGLFWGTLMSGAAFALVHGGPLLVVAILPIGVLLGIAYNKTQSLWVTMTMHATNNLVAVLLFYFGIGS